MKAVFGAFLIGIITQCLTVSAIDCFRCSDCGVPFDEDEGVTKEACDNKSCMKLNITHGGKVSIVSRGCSSGSGVEEERCDRKEVSGTYSEICYCNKDECNGSSETKFTFTVWMLVVIIMTPVFILKCINL